MMNQKLMMQMTSETEETYDDESETNNANVNNYLDSANMLTNLEKHSTLLKKKTCGLGTVEPQAT